MVVMKQTTNNILKFTKPQKTSQKINWNKNEGLTSLLK
jgi:hypothetical protein